MAQNDADKALTGKQARAAALLAADEISDEEIAAQLGVHRVTLARWKLLPQFIAAMNEHNAKVQASMLRLDIAKRHKRLAVLNTLHSKALRVIEERAAAYKDEDDALGGSTGLITKDIKSVGAGPSAMLVDVYGVDVSLMREIRALHEQAAKELGQWTEKVEQSGGVTVQLVGINTELI